MKSGPLAEIVIVGGGAAGWMTAAALARQWMTAGRRITLIESEEIGIVGVGEATIPPIAAFNAMLGIDERAFLRETFGTFKLGIEFVNWTRPGHSYMHPFGQFGSVNDVAFHHYFLRARRELGSDAVGEIGDHNLCDVASRLGRMARPSPDPGAVLSSLRYAYHFDASLYAQFLRRFAEKLGVRRIEGKVVEVRQHAEAGHIDRLVLDNGGEVAGELFVDCSGFRGLMIEQTLESGFEDWSHWLPCDRALAAPSRNPTALMPHTRSTAETAGWRWTIPLQHRTGNGHVYSSAFTSDQAAETLLREALGETILAEPRPLRFKAGKRKRFWSKNCVAIGLAAGFLEPLESTSIHLIQTGILKLLALLPDSTFCEVEIEEYNRTMDRQFDYIRDFIILHYHATERSDSDFWKYCQTMEIPASLKHRMDLFRSSGRVFRYEDELFDVSNWVAVFLGQGVTPLRYDPRADTLSQTDLQAMLAGLRGVVGRTARAMPMHLEYIKAIGLSVAPPPNQTKL